MNQSFVSGRLASCFRICPGILTLVALSFAGPQSAWSQEGEIDPVLIDKFDTFKIAQSTRQSGLPEFFPRRSEMEQQIVDALDQQTEVTFRDNGIAEALDYLKERHGIDVWVDKVRVNVEDYTVTLESSKVSLRSCLNLMLEPHRLCFLIEDDVLKVTTKEAAELKLITRTYPAADLFDSPEEAEELIGVLECGLGLKSSEEGPPPLKISTRSRAIVLRQTHQVHDQLLQLLRDLRATPEEPTSAEVVLNPTRSEKSSR